MSLMSVDGYIRGGFGLRFPTCNWDYESLDQDGHRGLRKTQLPAAHPLWELWERQQPPSHKDCARCKFYTKNGLPKDFDEARKTLQRPPLYVVDGNKKILRRCDKRDCDEYSPVIQRTDIHSPNHCWWRCTKCNHGAEYTGRSDYPYVAGKEISVAALERFVLSLSLP